MIQSCCFMPLVILSMVISSWVVVGEVDFGELVLNGDALQVMSRLFHRESYTCSNYLYSSHHHLVD